MVIFCVLLGVSFTWTPTKWLFLSRPSPDREAVRAELISSGVLGADAYVVVAGPANVYGHYVTTREEYAVQRYEGASTIFGQCECSSGCHTRRKSFHFAWKCYRLYMGLLSIWSCLVSYFSWFDGCRVASGLLAYEHIHFLSRSRLTDDPLSFFLGP